MSGPELQSDFADLLDALDAEAVEYLLVGAFALAANGVARQTGDMDVWVRPTAANAVRTHRALAKFGAPLATHGLRPEDLALPGTVYQMGLPPTRIEILTSIDGVLFEEAWGDALVARVGGRDLRFLGLRHLLINKRAAGRTKDLNDIELLREAGIKVAVDEAEPPATFGDSTARSGR